MSNQTQVCTSEEGAIINLKAGAAALMRLATYPVGSIMPDGQMVTAAEYEVALEMAAFMYADNKLILKWDFGYTEREVNAIAPTPFKAVQ